MTRARWTATAIMGAVMAALTPAGAADSDFAYYGPLGPAYWGSLDPAWEACSTGTRQSPVDIGVRTLFSEVSFHLPVRYGATRGEIFNNGHTIEVETEGANELEAGGERYELVQFHFHAPSEYRFAGRGADMELHLVHRSAAGRLAVVGVLLDRGTSSGALAPIFDEFPADVDVHHELDEPFNPETFLPRNRAHYRFGGSLTTPPCSEGVRWFVLAQPVTVSDEHLARFVSLVGFNARPVQRRFP